MTDTGFAPIWNAFNSGELSPLVQGRTDQAKYSSGCNTLINFIPTVQGPVVRRGGSRYLGAAKNGATERTWLHSFEFNAQQSYVSAWTGGTIRLWVDRGQLLNSGIPFEVATPYATADLVTPQGTFALRTAQSGDVMWCCHYSGAFPPYLLCRFGATDWTFTPDLLVNGPFNDIDPTETRTVYASAATGEVTLTASADIFTDADVGTSFYMEQVDSAQTRTWQADTKADIGDVRAFDGNFYRCTAVGSAGDGQQGTGDNPPVHTAGTVWDGDGYTKRSGDSLGDLGVAWTYLHSGYGWVNITSVTSPTVAIGNVVTGSTDLSAIFPGNTSSGSGITELPPLVTTSPGTTRWAHALFNSTDGWPTSVGFYRERLAYMSDRTLALSVVGSYADFSRKDGAVVTDDTGMVLVLAFDGGGDAQWLVESAGSLLVGTDRRELAIREQTVAQVFSASNAKNDPQTKYGSRQITPIAMGNLAVLFVTRSGLKVRELTPDPNTASSYKADDLTVLSEHITKSGIVDMAFAQEPNTVMWCVLGNGTVAAMTYNRERGVIAWARHQIGGVSASTPDYAFVESVASIPTSDGTRDDVWISVQRTINGEMVRYIEVIEDETLVELNTANGFYGDAGISYSGPPAQTITGVDHLDGETVQILANGSPHAERVVADGQITLDYPASIVQIGIDMPAQLQTMRAEGLIFGGKTTQTYRKTLPELWLRLVNTIGGMFGPSFDQLDSIPTLNPSAALGLPPPLFNGDFGSPMPPSEGTDGYVCVQSSPMLPMTLVALVGRMELGDD